MQVTKTRVFITALLALFAFVALGFVGPSTPTGPELQVGDSATTVLTTEDAMSAVGHALALEYSWSLNPPKASDTMRPGGTYYGNLTVTEVKKSEDGKFEDFTALFVSYKVNKAKPRPGDRSRAKKAAVNMLGCPSGLRPESHGLSLRGPIRILRQAVLRPVRTFG